MTERRDVPVNGRTRRAPLRGMCGRTTTIGLVLALLLSASVMDGRSAPSSQAAPASPVGSIDLATANRLVETYYRRVVSRLPRDWREAEERKLRDEPPSLGPHGIFQIMSPAGTLAFEHDAEARTLHCFAVIQKVRRGFPLIGLTQEEILTALRMRQAQGVETGGGALVYEPVSNGFFLQRDYLHPPDDIDRMTRELDRLTEAAEAWRREHYLEAVLGHARTLGPPATATARSGDFRATVVLSPDSRYFDLWKRPPGAIQPQLVSRAKIAKPASLFVQLFFSGATAGDDGKAVVEAELTVVRPDGAPAGRLPVPLWNAPPPPATHLQLGDNHTEIEFDAGRPTGRYLVRGRVCDVVAERCVIVEHPVEVLERREP